LVGPLLVLMNNCVFLCWGGGGGRDLVCLDGVFLI